MGKYDGMRSFQGDLGPLVGSTLLVIFVRERCLAPFVFNPTRDRGKGRGDKRSQEPLGATKRPQEAPKSDPRAP